MRPSVIISFLIMSTTGPLMAQNAYVRLGKQAFIDGDFKLAVMQLEKACLIDSTNSNALFMLGYSYFHSDNYAKSITAFSKEIVILPTDAQGYYYRALAKTHLGKDIQLTDADRERYLLGAIFDFTRAIAINPGDTKIASFYQNRGIAYREYGVFKLQPGSKVYDHARGVGALKASIDDLQKVLSSDPGRNDIASLIDLSKEKLSGSMHH